ncbi:hypothetical protein [Pantanalinema sp. GBBB05]|uniref:hypothetical protein n=1 Tax=Pantanalinema sp. GBBB05 TaxID=2604139 RepID=UPI001DCE53B7|nr:hypothetical protein [Pantanalinema sp. GBBB05]
MGLLQWIIIKLFPDWYYRQTWRWGRTEATARQQLLEKSKETGSIQLYRDLIAEAHEILLSFLNKNSSGFCLEDSISKELSIGDFKRLYIIVIALLAVRLQVSKADKFRREMLTLFPGEVSMTETLIQELEIHNNDEREQALFAWNYILDIIGRDRSTVNGLWKGCFVVFTENSVKRLRSRWE